MEWLRDLRAVKPGSPLVALEPKKDDRSRSTLSVHGLKSGRPYLSEGIL